MENKGRTFEISKLQFANERIAKFDNLSEKLSIRIFLELSKFRYNNLFVTSSDKKLSINLSKVFSGNGPKDKLLIFAFFTKFLILSNSEEEISTSLKAKADKLECFDDITASAKSLKFPSGLFLKDNLGKYYLYIFDDTFKANIKALEKFLGVKKLHFGSSEELENILKLIPGGVTPLGIINDSKTQVTVIIDNSLVNQLILMHMDTNTITISIDYNDLIKYITYLKHEYKIFKGDNNE